MIGLLVALICVAGAVFLALGSIGLVGASHRHNRTEAVTKAGVFGVAMIILAVSAGAGIFMLLVQGLIAVTVLVLSGLILAPILAEWDWIAQARGEISGEADPDEDMSQ